MSTVIDKIVNNEFILIGEIGVNYYDIAQKEKISPLDAAIRSCKKINCSRIAAPSVSAGLLTRHLRSGLLLINGHVIILRLLNVRYKIWL